MRWQAIRWLNLRQFRRQPLRSALAVLALAGGVALTVGVVIVNTSAQRSLDESTQSLSGHSTLRVTGANPQGGLDQVMVDRLAGLDGVAAAVPLIRAVTVAEDGAGHDRLIIAIGADCRAVTLIGGVGCPRAKSRSSRVIVGPSLARSLGSAGVIRTNERRVPIAEATTFDALDDVNDGRVAVFDLATAQRLFARPGSVDVIEIVARPGVNDDGLAARVRHEVGDWATVTRADDSTQVQGFGPFAAIAGVISLFALAIGGQLVFSVVALSLEERRRELAIALAIGARPSVILTGCLAETAVIGMAGSVLGLAGGVVGARPVLSAVSYFTEHQNGITLRLHLAPVAFMLAGLVGVGVAVAAAVIPIRRVLAADIAGEIKGRTPRRSARSAGHTTRGVVLVTVGMAGILLGWIGHRGGALEAWQPPLTTFSVMLTSVCLFRAVGDLGPAFIGSLRRIPAFATGSGRVAIGNLSSDPRRTGTVLVAVGIAVGLAAVLTVMLDGLGRGGRDLADLRAGGRVWASTLEANSFSAVNGRPSPATIARLAEVPGVARVDQTFGIVLEHPSIGVLSVDADTGPPPRDHVFAGRGVEDALAHGQVMVGAGFARAQRLRPGSTLHLPGRHATVTVTVGGIWDDGSNLGRSVWMSKDQLFAIWGPQPPTRLFIQPVPGVSEGALAGRLTGAGIDPDLRVLTVRGYGDELAASFREFVAPFWVLQRGMLLVALVTTVSTLLVNGLRRRREHAILVAVGAAPGRLRSVQLVEGILIGVVGSVLGMAAGLAASVPVGYVTYLASGFRPPVRIDLAALVVTSLVASALVVMGTVWPAIRSARLDVSATLRAE